MSSVLLQGLEQALGSKTQNPMHLPAIFLHFETHCTLYAVSEAVLAGPEATARAAAAGSNKHRVELEAAIASAVSDALHLLGAIKQVRPATCLFSRLP